MAAHWDSMLDNCLVDWLVIQLAEMSGLLMVDFVAKVLSAVSQLTSSSMTRKHKIIAKLRVQIENRLYVSDQSE